MTSSPRRDAGRTGRSAGARGLTCVVVAFALICALACGSPSPSDPDPSPSDTETPTSDHETGTPAPERSPSGPDEPRTVLEMIKGCLDSRGHHPVLEEFARTLFEGSEIEIDRTLHGIGDIDGDGEVQLTMVVSHPRRKAMRIYGALHFETCEVEITYPPQQGTPHDQCRFLSEQGNYGRCELNPRGDCTCNPE